ncbi:MAG: alpha/beta hydrolase [Puniceicoccales bacterium]|jgi:acetyl esterase/lipase|nr:alpha/beta hydrolase [Puniceicoccales bacterium]
MKNTTLALSASSDTRFAVCPDATAAHSATARRFTARRAATARRIVRLLAVALCAMLFAAPQGRAAETPFPIWPGQPVGETAPAKPEIARNRSIRQVWTPTLEFYPVPEDKNTGALVVVCPGGGYGGLASEHEGVEIAQWLNTLGVNAAILKYRVPTRPNTKRGVMPLKDIQRALGVVRSKAATWKIDPARIGVIGFSAGGHLCALASTAPERTYAPVDDADSHSFRPNFALLIYPAYIVERGKWDPAVQITAQTPPTFFAHAADDGYTYESSLQYFQAQRKHRTKSELHVFASGGHGFGLGPTTAASQWPACAAAWLKSGGWLGKK